MSAVNSHALLPWMTTAGTTNNASAFTWTTCLSGGCIHNRLISHSPDPQLEQHRLQAMAPQVPVLTLNNGRPFPIVGYGTWAWDGTGERQLFVDAVYDAIVTGYRHIDTAWLYRVEKEVGMGVRRAIDEGIVKREDMTIVTKVWATHFRADRVRKSAMESNENLGLGYIDVLLLHFPVPLVDKEPPPGMPFALNEDGGVAFDDSIDMFNETWPAMEKLVDDGITKSIGISNFSTTQVEQLVTGCRIKPVVNQVECHPILPQDKLLSVCKKHDIVLTAYSPFAGSPRPQPDGTYAPCPLKQRLFESEVVKGLAAKYAKTAGQILLKFHVARGVAVIPKSVTKSRIKENLDIFDFDLTDEDLKSLATLATGERMAVLPGLEKSKYNPYTD